MSRKRTPPRKFNYKLLLIIAIATIIFSTFAYILYHADSYKQAFYIIGKTFYVAIGGLFGWYVHMAIKYCK